MAIALWDQGKWDVDQWGPGVTTTIFTSQPGVTSTASQLVASRVNRIDLKIRLLSNAAPLEVAFASFVLGNGYVVPVGTDFVLQGYTGAIWGAVSSGTTPITATVLETV
jgi:hypothetical protein